MTTPTAQRMYDISWQIDGDQVDLTQTDFCGEESLVRLHRSQLRVIAEQAGLINPTWNRVHHPVDHGIDEMHHLEVDVGDDGAVHVLQTQLTGMGGNDEHLILHPIQAEWLGTRLLAEYPGQGESDDGTERARRLAITMRKLWRQLQELADCLLDDDEMEYSPGVNCGLCAIHDTASLLHFDLTGDEPDRASPSEHNDNSPAISVTHNGNSRVGRPPTGTAKSNAQRQREHRQRRAAGADLKAPPSPGAADR